MKNKFSIKITPFKGFGIGFSLDMKGLFIVIAFIQIEINFGIDNYNF